MDKLLRYLITATLVIACLIGANCYSYAQNKTVASLYSNEGSIFVRRTGVSVWQPIKGGDSFYEGDTVRTGTDGKAAFQFVDGALVRIGRFSAMTFEKVLANGNPSVTHTQGKAYFFSRGARREPEINTTTVNAAIFGTELVIETNEDSTTIDVLHGSVKASNSFGATTLAPGERAVTKRGSPPAKSILVRPADSVQWMIRFPFILIESDIVSSPDVGCSGACASAVHEVFTQVKSGRSLIEALNNSSNKLKSTDRGALLEAIALWRVGEIARAAANIKAMSQTMSAPDSALRELLLGFLELQNSNLTAAQQHLSASTKLRADLINAQLLQSYISQASGDLDDALSIIKSSRQEHQDVPELFDREAELLLSFDRYEDTKALLEKRELAFGTSSMSAALSGFAAISRKDFAQAQLDFATALSEDPSQALPYFGQALIKVNDRDYDSAKDLLSHAVQLEPSTAIYRSYLGKLFFENAQSEHSRQEFDAAIALDPNDPTPHLYRSFVDVAQNDPIKGLADVEQSIQLNDGRAVYRSSLLLDRDLAVRSAGLSRVFTELGFSEAARIEAIKSITTDYGNYSAHRLLSESYDSILDVEARQSEQRVADLMAPLSFNLFNSLGEAAALGDYNALFDKKETREAFSTTWNSNQDQIGGELLAVGKGDSLGYLFSYQPFYRNGSNHGAFASQNRLRGALQYELTPDDRLILDGSFKLFRQEGQTDADYSDDVHVGVVRAGYNHRISSNTRFLMQGEFARDRENTAIERDDRPGIVQENIPDGAEFDADLVAQESARQRVQRNSLATQLLYTSTYLDSVSGVEGLYADTSRRETSPAYGFYSLCQDDSGEECGTGAGGDLTSSASGALRSGEVYQYVSLKVPRKANLTLGLAGTSVEHDLTEVPPFLSGRGKENSLDPKIGLVLTPTKWLTTRAAYFETLQKSVLEDLSSLEPTLIGGLNQRFNDLSAARSRNLAFGLDVKDPNLFYAGAQYTRRHIIEPIGDVTETASYDGENLASLPPSSDGFIDSNANSDIFRGYLYSVLSPRAVLTADTLMNWYDLDEFGSTDSTNTRRFRFGYRRFFGKHLSLSTQGTFRDQNTTTSADTTRSYDNGGFWLFDTALSYRLSEQRGRMFFRIDNILDREFEYDQSVGLEPAVLKGRSFILGISYNFF